jgi:hypothetical protein
MREGWEVLPFGDVLTHDVRKVPVEVGRHYPIVGVLGFGRGLLFRAPVSAETTSYRDLNAIGPDQVVFSKLKAFEGAITVTPPDLAESYASSEFPTFTVTERAIPGFIRLLTQRSELWAAMAANSKGMGGRRERLSPLDFLAVRATFPPIADQRRIVDLIVALDDTIAAAEAARRAQALNVRCQRSLVFNARETAPAGDMFDILIGVQRNPARAAGDNQAHYLRSANVGFGVLDLSDIYTMSFSGAERAKYALQTDDVLVSEGSASETAVGAPCRWQGEIGETVCFQNTLLRYRSRPGRTTPAFVDHWCAWAYESGAFREVAGGSNIKHIGARRAELMPVAAIPISEQPDMLAPVEAAAEALRASETHMRSLQALRAAALMALLSGEHEIPESYDELMEVAS